MSQPSKQSSGPSKRVSNTVKLELTDLFCERAERILFANLDYTIKPGQGTRILGANGAGKTTLLRLIAGLNQQYEGEVSWCGQNIRRDKTHYLENLLYLGHSPGLKSVLTPYENLLWWTQLHQSGSSMPIVSKEEMEEALADVGLTQFMHSPCYQLSAGQQRRAGLARLFLSSYEDNHWIGPRLWLLDEPFTAIDRHGVKQLEDRFSDHLEKGGMIIITTHQDLKVNGFGTLNLDDYAYQDDAA